MIFKVLMDIQSALNIQMVEVNVINRQQSRKERQRQAKAKRHAEFERSYLAIGAHHKQQAEKKWGWK